MPAAQKHVRKSVALAPTVARRVRQLAKADGTSDTKVLTDLIEKGIEAQEHEKREFYRIGGQFIRSKDRREQQRLPEKLSKMIFGR